MICTICTIEMYDLLYLHYRNTRFALLKRTIHTICTIEGLSIGEPGAPQGRGNQLAHVGGTSAGNVLPLTFSVFPGFGHKKLDVDQEWLICGLAGEIMGCHDIYVLQPKGVLRNHSLRTPAPQLLLQLVVGTGQPK